jgi:hypothetical protein
VTLASRSLLINVHPTHTNVRGVGAATKFEEEGLLRIMVDGECVQMPALAASKEQLPTACLALLGMPAIGALNISLDAQRVEQDQPLICYLGEKKLREWWDHNSDKSVDTKPFDRSKIKICPDLPAAVIQRVKQIIDEHHDVFEGIENTLPKPFNAKPVELNFKIGFRPRSIAEPRWTTAMGNVIRKWALQGLENGSLEHSKSEWSSRPHVVLKAPANATADSAPVQDCKLRVVGDYREVNQEIAKLVPNLPTGIHEMEKACGYKYYFESDSVACYNSFVLAPGLSREALAVWTPLGLVQPTVLPLLRAKELRHRGTRALSRCS